jgi:hypothetical protein
MTALFSPRLLKEAGIGFYGADVVFNEGLISFAVLSLLVRPLHSFAELDESPFGMNDTLSSLFQSVYLIERGLRQPEVWMGV